MLMQSVDSVSPLDRPLVVSHSLSLINLLDSPCLLSVGLDDSSGLQVKSLVTKLTQPPLHPCSSYSQISGKVLGQGIGWGHSMLAKSHCYAEAMICSSF